ncbi:probable 39S ribosomal protein L49, mitochondrial [Leguminivora glycinivorella]|uniref:probable 39S ribosomal protein L49, mitochondrial n=1 Tax=Leguminivora glycinivorella TaxID=1035111 RepID=UPI00200E1D78|nr:probable 39S ribosomal protein L49, mitochondrial [Leguminivora glycinivorella]
MAAMWRAQCAFARLFTGKTGQILNNAADFGTKLTPESLSVLVSRNYSNYKNSPLVHKIREQYEYEIVKNPAEWTYVERLLPFETIPEVQPKANYPSGWVPPKEEALELPYFISRTKNHVLPIYLGETFKGGRKITMIKKIDGDIWQMNDEIKELLEEKMKRYVETRVHELGRFIEVKGDYVNELRDWAHSKGF